MKDTARVFTLLVFSTGLVLWSGQVSPTRAAPTSSARFSYGDGTVTLTLSIKLWGPGASSELAAEWERWIESTLNEAAAEYGCYPMEFEVDVQFSFPLFTTDEEGYDEKKGANFFLPLLYPLDDDVQVEIEHRNLTMAAELAGPQLEAGWEYWYVPVGTEIRRAWANLGAYQSEGHGMVPSGASRYVVTHEATHVLGVDDKYDYVTEQPLPGWDGNVMASYNGTYDERNFHEILDVIEENLGDETSLPTCLRLETLLDFVSYSHPATVGAPCDNDSAIGDLRFSALIESASAFDPDAPVTLTIGSGELHWSILERCQSGVWGVETPNNPFPVEVTGFIDTGPGNSPVSYALGIAAYRIKSQTAETICFNNINGQICDTGFLNSILSASTLITGPSGAGGTLAELILPQNVKTGDQLSYDIFRDTPHPHWYDGEGVVTVVDKYEGW